MMEEMKAKGIKEKKDEEVAFSTFSQWCTDTSGTRQKAIEDGAAKIEKLDADIATAISDIEGLTKDLAELDEDLGRWDTDKKAASDVRKKERTDYEATHRDYADTIDALERALNVLKKNAGNIAQKSLIQTHLEKVAMAPLVPKEASRTLIAFLQNEQPKGLEY